MLAIMAHDLSDERTTPFQVMPAQQHLHVLDSLDIANSPDLLDIVINVRHRESHLERDKTFTVLGAADSNSEDVQRFSQLMNYGNLSTHGLYKEFARYWIEDKHDLRVLQACNPAQTKVEGLPTWVADWSDITVSHQLSTRLYRAAKDTEVEVQHHYHKSSDELHLRGIPIDKIKIICKDARLDELEQKFIDETADCDHFREQLAHPFAALYMSGVHPEYMSALLENNWLEAAKQVQWDKPYLPTGQAMGEAYWPTLLEDHDPYAKFGAKQRIPADMNISDDIFDPWAQKVALTRSLRPRSDSHRSDELAARWYERLQTTIKQKRFFVTEKGLIGIAMSNAEPGHVVCLFLGGPVPFSLCQVQDHYELVEETYIHGFMDGRAIDMVNNGELEVVDLCIR
jgi:hypothetical protein